MPTDPVRTTPPPITLPAWWIDVRQSIGTVLGLPAADAVAVFTELDEGERAAYMAVLNYHQLHALAELDTSVRRLEQKVARLGGVTRQQLDRLLEVMANLAVEEDEDPGDNLDSEEPEEEEEEEEEEPAPPPKRPAAKPTPTKRPAPSKDNKKADKKADAPPQPAATEAS